MSWRNLPSLALICVTSSLASCGKSAPAIPNQVPTTRVFGVVTVDGKPAEAVTVRANPLTAFPEERAKYKQGLLTQTRADGKFTFGIYQRDGGIPVGEYALTFLWFNSNTSSALEANKDLLNGLYSPVDKSPKKFTVEAGKPLDLGTIELKTQ